MYFRLACLFSAVQCSGMAWHGEMNSHKLKRCNGKMPVAVDRPGKGGLLTRKATFLHVGKGRNQFLNQRKPPLKPQNVSPFSGGGGGRL